MKEQLSAKLETSKNYTLAVAEAMPGNDYSFKPTESVWNFGELMHHIGYGISWWQDNFLKGIKAAWEPTAVPANKKEAIKYLEQAYASLQETINKMKYTDDTIQGFFATLDHITHHRGQATIYLRCKGINPPEYTY